MGPTFSVEADGQGGTGGGGGPPASLSDRPRCAGVAGPLVHVGFFGPTPPENGTPP